MATESIKVSITPREAQEIVERYITADLVDTQKFSLGEGREVYISIYERYFFRSSNRAALTITFDNVYGETNVKIVSTGSSQGVIFNFDWGAASSFVGEAIRALDRYRI